MLPPLLNILLLLGLIRWQSRRMFTHLLLQELQNYNSPLNKTSTEKYWIPPKKDTPHLRAKEKPQQDGRRGEITFRIKLHTHQRQLRAQTKPLCAPGPRDPTETERDLCLSLLWRYRSEACCRDRGSGCSYLGHTACCISSLGGSHH